MHPKLELEVGGTRRKVKIAALIDTGFTGYLALPVDIAKELGVELSGQEKFELANGEWISQILCKGYVVFLDKTYEVEILIGDSPTPQVGVSLLSDCKLTIDFVSSEVQVIRLEL